MLIDWQCERKRGFMYHSQVFSPRNREIDIPLTEVRKITGEVSDGKEKKLFLGYFIVKMPNRYSKSICAVKNNSRRQDTIMSKGL